MPPIASILVPLDGSPLAEQALPVARALAREHGAAVSVVTVFAARALDVAPAGLVDTSSGDDELRAELDRYLGELAARCAQEGGAPVRCERLEAVAMVGPAGEAPTVAARLAQEVARRGVDLVVMTTHGRGGVSRLWLGSVADGLLRHGGVPVLLVRSGDAPQPARPIARMTIALDGSPQAERALDAAHLVAPHAARWLLVRAVAPRRAIARPAPVTRVDLPALARDREEAERYLVAVCARAPAPHRVEIRVGIDESPARAILEAAREDDADCIALATHARTALGRMMLGSVADKVIRGATHLVLVVRSAPA